MLTNLPVYYRKVATCEINKISELLKIQHYNHKGRSPYSTTVFRLALIMRYTSNSGYRYLQRFLPLQSYSKLYKLKSEPINNTVKHTQKYEIANICFMVILICKSHIRSPFAPITSQFSEKHNVWIFLILKKNDVMKLGYINDIIICLV